MDIAEDQVVIVLNETLLDEKLVVARVVVLGQSRETEVGLDLIANQGECLRTVCRMKTASPEWWKRTNDNRMVVVNGWEEPTGWVVEMEVRNCGSVR